MSSRRRLGAISALVLGSFLGLTLLPVAWADYFGRANYGAIRGLALSAQVLALEGKGEAALGEMNRALGLGFWTPNTTGLALYPAFDTLRSTAGFRQLEDRFKRKAALERQQVLQQQRRTGAS